MNKPALLLSLLSVASVSGCQSLLGSSEAVPLDVQGYEITVSTGKPLDPSQALSQVFLHDGYNEVDNFGRKGENDKVQAASIHHQGLSEIVLKESDARNLRVRQFAEQKLFQVNPRVTSSLVASYPLGMRQTVFSQS